MAEVQHPKIGDICKCETCGEVFRLVAVDVAHAMLSGGAITHYGNKGHDHVCGSYDITRIKRVKD